MMTNVDSVRELIAHSSSTKSTYAYQFSEYYDLPTYKGLPSWVGDVLSWLRTSATHGDELSFVFGNMYNKENNIRKGRLTILVLLKQR